MTYAIQTTHVTKLYRAPNGNTFKALNDVTLTVEAGTAVGLVGVNGSGKTTLLRIIAGILTPTSGSIRIKGQAIGFFELGAVFHEDLRLADNIRLYGALINKSAHVRRHLHDILAFAELTEFASFPFKDLSQGMKARLALATIAYCDPDIYLIDEALAVGDEKFREKAYQMFKDIKQRGKTLVITSHDPSIISELCDTAVLFEKGNQIRSGTSEEVLSTYHERI